MDFPPEETESFWIMEWMNLPCLFCLHNFHIKAYLTAMYTQGTKFPFNYTNTVPFS